MANLFWCKSSYQFSLQGSGFFMNKHKDDYVLEIMLETHDLPVVICFTLILKTMKGT